MFKEPIQIIIGLLLWIIATPFLILILIFLTLWKSIVILCIKIKFRNSDTSYDSTKIPDSIGNIVSLAFVGEGLVDCQKLKTHFHDTFIKDGKDVKYPVFHYTLTHVLGFTYKIKAPLDLNFHIREEDFHPRRETENEALIRIANNNLKFRGFVPKWEMVLLHNVQEKRSTFIFKISHALVDAYSLRILMDTFIGTQTSYRTAKSTIPTGFLGRAKLGAKLPLLALLILKNFIKVRSKRLAFLDSSNVPQTFCWTKTSMNFNVVKKLSENSGCKISAILMSAFLSTLKKSIPSWDDVCVANHDNFMYFEPIPNHPAEKGKFCNNMFPAMIGLPLKEKNELKQLEAIQKNLVDYESSQLYPETILLLTIMNPIILPTFLLIKITFPYTAFVTTFNPFVYSPIGYNILGTNKITNLYYVYAVDYPYKLRGIIFTPLTLGNQIDFSLHASQGIFRNMAEADLFLIKMKQEIQLLRNTWQEG